MAQLTFFSPKSTDKSVGYLIGASGFGHHLAEHGAQGHDDGDVPQSCADTRLQKSG